MTQLELFSLVLFTVCIVVPMAAITRAVLKSTRERNVGDIDALDQTLETINKMSKRIAALEAASEQERLAFQAQKTALLETLNKTIQECNAERVEMLERFTKQRLEWEGERTELYRAGEELAARLEALEKAVGNGT